MIALLLLACVAEPEGLSYELDIAPVIRSECNSCHRSELAEGQLELASDGYGALFEVPSNQADLLLVEPGDHLYSYLWHKLGGTQTIAGGSGTSMPMDGSLDAEVIDLVAEWIDEGALP